MGGALESFQCVDALEVSLCIEKQGFIFYDKAAKNATDPRVRTMFFHLANEEKEHIQSLQNKARFLRPALTKKSFPNHSKAENFIKREIEGKVFPASLSPNKKSGDVKNDLDVLNIGIEAEKRSIKVLAQLVDQEKKMDVRMVFNHLLAEERKHLVALEGLKQDLGQT